MALTRTRFGDVPSVSLIMVVVGRIYRNMEMKELGTRRMKRPKKNEEG